MTNITLGSLFSGSGGFELAGMLCGIEPVWASEIAPFPIRVTTKRLPQVKHYGDIRHINGADIEPVSIISFGSPCVDMSIASRERPGLHGKNSSLFFEAIRIIKEMRCASYGRFPRFAVMENVLGMLGSAGGADFQQILTEIARIKDETHVIPMPPQGKWLHAGEILGDDFSIAWRVLGSQHFGVPQRRNRCYIVADFASDRAGKVLFEREGERRDYSPRERTRQDSAGHPADRAGESSESLTYAFEPGAASRLGGHVWEEMAGTLRADAGDNQLAVLFPFGIGSHASHGMLSDNPHSGIYEAKTSKTLDCGGGNPARHQGGIAVVEETYCMPVAGFSNFSKNIAGTLTARDAKDAPIVQQNYRARRLLPCECAMLQGFDPAWCSGLETPEPTEEDIAFWSDVFETYRKAIGKSSRPRSRNQIIKWLKNPHTDSAEYALWGNGISLPVVIYIFIGIVRELSRESL